jgi:AbrB family looped-hinge helix DNA binding protein
MNNIITTVSTKGQMIIPAEMRAKLDIKPGTRISVSIEDGKLILQPIAANPLDVLQGMFKGGPSMFDEMQKERRSDKW